MLCLALSSSKEGGTAAALSTAATADDLSFEELVALAQPSDLALDSYSTRGVLNAAPRSAAVLSSLKLAPERFLQRYSVVADSGGRAGSGLMGGWEGLAASSWRLSASCSATQ